MGPIWNSINSEFGADPDYFLMWMDDSNNEDEWYDISQDKFGEFEREEMKLSDNTPLVLAVIFSFVLGIVGAIGAMIAAFWYLRKGSIKFWKNVDHIRRFKQTALTVGSR